MPAPRTEREFALSVVRTLRAAGHEALWAGGCVRDELLGLTPKDFDVATSAHPAQVQKLFRHTIPVGVSFGVVEVLGPRIGGAHLRTQVATFRAEADYDGRSPGEVVFTTAEADARRRDFTINGMFFDPLEGRVIDYVGGRADLDARVLRSIGDPLERFEEDRLRMLRAARLAARLDLAVEPATAAAIVRMAPRLGEGVSAERIADEFRKMLVDRRRARGMRLFMDLGLAAVVLPELVPMRGLPQGLPRPGGPGLPPPGRAGLDLSAPGGPPDDLWEHVLRVMDLLEGPVSFPLAMAALLHDVGKPRTVGRTADRYTFHAHEHVGRRMAGEIAGRLKLSNEERDRIEWLVEKHQILADAARMRPAKLKVLLVHKGVAELFALHRADALGSGRSVEHVEHAERLRQEWQEKGELEPPPLIDGNDLIALGMRQGPLFKVLLDRAREAQLDGQVGAREEALDLVRRVAAELSPGDAR
jgi:poly(A) polymerase